MYEYHVVCKLNGREFGVFNADTLAEAKKAFKIKLAQETDPGFCKQIRGYYFVAV